MDQKKRTPAVSQEIVLKCDNKAFVLSDVIVMRNTTQECNIFYRETLC